MVADDDQSCFRHSKASWDWSKTAQPLKTQSGNWFVGAIKTRCAGTSNHLRNTSPSLISVTIFITLNVIRCVLQFAEADILAGILSSSLISKLSEFGKVALVLIYLLSQIIFILRTHISYTTNTWWNNTWQNHLGIAFFIYEDIWPIRTIFLPKHPWKYRGHFGSLLKWDVVFAVLICQIATLQLCVCVF